MKERNTKQKELILNVIRNNRIHPTIYEIYDLVKKIDSTIGQATIYRNVKKFVETKKVYVVKTNDGVDRYDYYDNHVHFECLKCHKIIDIMDDELFKVLNTRYKDIKENILEYKVSLNGYCEECKRGSNEEVSL